MKKNRKKGFTLAELLIVVAVIAVLAAIAFPIFSKQMDKAKKGVDAANARAIESMAVSEALATNEPDGFYYGQIDDKGNITLSNMDAGSAPAGGYNQATQGENEPKAGVCKVTIADYKVSKVEWVAGT